MDNMDNSEILYDRIFNLPQSHEEIRSLKKLTDELEVIISQIKSLRIEGRLQEIEKKCFGNKKLFFMSKILKENYFKVFERPLETEEVTTMKNISDLQLQKKESELPFLNVQSSSSNLGNSRYMVTTFEYKLKIAIISMFCNMLVNEKMQSFINQMSIPLHIYVIILKIFTSREGIVSRFKFRETEKCLKFMYQYIKATKQYIPKVYIHISKNLLELYHKNYESQLQDSSVDNKDRIKLCYSYIFQISTLILKKNLFLASKCGILSLLYHKCIEGAITIRKVQIIVEIIINYCIQQKTRLIVYNTIDFGKTFAIFTNVDMVQSIHEKLSIGNKSRVDLGAANNNIKNLDCYKSCAVMIEMYLSNWSTLIYFMQEGRTLRNFIISLKRKSQEQLNILNERVFKKIMKRCINYNRKKIIKSNNIFNIESNYLILKSLLILNFFYKHDEFKELIYGNIMMLDFKEGFIQILLQYFITNEEEYKNRQVNKILINNIKNINYYKKINIDISMKRLEDQGVINNNIQSYYTESLLPFEFNVKELKEYLIKIADIVQDQKNKLEVCSLLSEISEREGFNFKGQANDILSQQELLKFYRLGLEISKQIRWFDRYLDISQYLSSILQHLRQSPAIISISQRCREYIKTIFEAPQFKYFQYLNINTLDDIGRYFYSDNKIIEYLNGYISDINQAYKISRILLHIDYERNNNQSIDGPEKIYSEISKRGSKALILQIIEIIKYSCEQNDNRFLNEHLQILFTLIYDSDEDIVYSIIELLEEFVNKSKELEEYILKIEMKKIRNWSKRILYLFLHYQNAIPYIKESREIKESKEGKDGKDFKQGKFLNDQLQKWQSGSQNRKKTYYIFVMKQLKKFTHDSILSTDYLNLNLDPSNYRKLIFLPWNIKINEEFYPTFIEYKNLQDKLKLKIYINLIILKEIIIQELFIGSHNYSKYVQVKHVFEKKKEDLKIKLTLEEIKKQHGNKGKELNKFVMQREQAIFFITYEQQIYKIDRININIPLTLDTYRPLSHPLNFINLLCRTKMGFQFLKKEKFIDHCLQVIKNDQQNKEEYKGALICLGTLCASPQMPVSQKIDIYELITKKFSSKDHQVQEICLWIINILIKVHIIRGRTKKEFSLIETKRCGWICLPDISYTSIEKFNPNMKERMENNIKYIKENLPEKLDNQAYKYLCNILNDVCRQDQTNAVRIKDLFEAGRLEGKVIENIIKYVSVIDFSPTRIYQVLHKLGSYFINQKCELDFPNGILLP